MPKNKWVCSKCNLAETLNLGKVCTDCLNLADARESECVQGKPGASNNPPDKNGKQME